MTDETAPGADRDHLPCGQYRAFGIGIDSYAKVSRLQTAVNDARQLAVVPGTQRHFTVHLPLAAAKGSDIRELLHATLPRLVDKDDRVFRPAHRKPTTPDQSRA